MPKPVLYATPGAIISRARSPSLHLRVVADLAVSQAWFIYVLGARLALTVAGGPTADKPTVTFAAVSDPDTVSAELVLRVADTHSTHAALLARGATLLNPTGRVPLGTRCLVRDPDGHLIEITQPSR